MQHPTIMFCLPILRSLDSYLYIWSWVPQHQLITVIPTEYWVFLVCNRPPLFLYNYTYSWSDNLINTNTIIMYFLNCIFIVTAELFYSGYKRSSPQTTQTPPLPPTYCHYSQGVIAFRDTDGSMCYLHTHFSIWPTLKITVKL